MATELSSVVQNENLHFHAGKGAGGAKVDVPKSKQKGRKMRKPLADISKAGKPSVAKFSSLKERPVVQDKEKTQGTRKRSELTEEETRRCNEWAKEGMEHSHFSGIDFFALQKHDAEKRTEKKVEKVITALREWIQISYGLERQAKELGKDPEEFMKLVPEPDVILPVINVPISASVGEQSDDPFLGEKHDNWPIQDLLFDLKLKEEYQGDMVCL